MSRTLELVIFDCDGVLVDSERIAVRTDVQVLAKLGWIMTEAECIERFVGLSDKSIKAAIEAQLGCVLPDDWDQEFQSLYRDAFSAELTPVPGVVDALDRITLPTCVASSSSHDKLRFTLGLTGLYERFAGRIFSAYDVARGKPAPDLFLHAAKQMGVEPAACAVVEDSKYGIEAARAAGMRAFGFAGGLTPRAWLEAPGTVVFSDMRELPGVLARAGA
jgi:HAD superfamily hydrolase (TIGR01509 family)